MCRMIHTEKTVRQAQLEVEAKDKNKQFQGICGALWHPR